MPQPAAGGSKEQAGRASPEIERSVRVELARLALAAALEVDGVVGAAPGPHGLFVTRDRDLRLSGVTAAALADGRYAVTLHLVVRLVPLPALADRVREQVTRSAARAGLADALGPVDIEIDDLVQPGATA